MVEENVCLPQFLERPRAILSWAKETSNSPYSKVKKGQPSLERQIIKNKI